MDKSMLPGNENLLLVAVFIMILGFGVKSGMFPLHAWLPTAHPVAPAPASAVLSAVIVKGGVLGMIRVVYYMFGADFIRGTWVQTVWLTLTLITIFMGSMLAYREKVLKKKAGLFHSKSGILYFVRVGPAPANSFRRSFLACGIPCICQVRVIFGCRGRDT